MHEPGIGGDFSVALVNAVLLALWLVLPGLLLCYMRQSLTARRIRPEFSLRKSEAIELDRAVLLYEKVCYRLQEINDQGESPNGFWRALFGRGADIRQQHADELDDLEAHAHHLRATIIRLKCRPLQRLRSWVHIISSQFALGRALAVHVVSLALLIVEFHVSKRLAWADELTSGVRSLLVWYPLEEHLFFANAVAAGFAAMAAPVFYLMRRASLRQEYRLEFCALKEFADTDPGQVIDQTQADQTDWDPSQQADSREVGGDNSCFAVLGLAHSATIEEVKEAYKALIKQNHPDRVHGMSPAFRELAEAETKKLNAAYRQALIFVPLLESRHGAAANCAAPN
jgi:DnaJ domain